MRHHYRKSLPYLFCIVVWLCGTGCVTTRFGSQAEQPPLPQREFRAVWVATVGNIDWPSKSGLTTTAQQAEALAILDRCAELNMNAVVLQVRPQADVFYPSELEPWSTYLSGEQGKAPEPFYDPLAFWIEEAHARGIRLHAWLNPYRALARAKSAVSDQSVIKQRPELVRKLANGMYWMDPAEPAVQDRTVAIVREILARYDVDGIHIDDYFYPYPAYNDNADFPDDPSWNRYRKSGGTPSRDDWRRDQVNRFVRRLYKTIKKDAKHVEFGISPFGIWRPGHPPSIKGLDQYDVLYADARLWLREGWLDYWAPQLYWPVAQTPQSFPVLLDWWSQQNLKKRNLWPGLYTVKPTMSADEIAGQILVSRGMLGDGAGAIHFSAKALTSNDKGMVDRLKALYAEPALRPTATWLDRQAPRRPCVDVEAEGDHFRIGWRAPRGEAPAWWLLSVRRGETWSHQLLPPATREFRIPQNGVAAIAVRAVDRLGNVSPAATR